MKLTHFKKNMPRRVGLFTSSVVVVPLPVLCLTPAPAQLGRRGL